MSSGLAVAVYHSGRPVLVRGFGSARLGREDSDMVDRPVPVTENTKFAIASLSKAFTAALIGILLKEQETRFVFPKQDPSLLTYLLTTVVWLKLSRILRLFGGICT